MFLIPFFAKYAWPHPSYKNATVFSEIYYINLDGCVFMFIGNGEVKPLCVSFCVSVRTHYAIILVLAKFIYLIKISSFEYTIKCKVFFGLNLFSILFCVVIS